MSERLEVRKTYKLFVGGQFPRSESGRSFAVRDAGGSVWAHASLASRKDLRDAVRVARGALGGWAGRTAYNRGQVLYRVAEVLEGRRGQFEHELGRCGVPEPEAEVDAAVDCWVWYAGWADKLHQVAGNANAVAGPYFNLTVPEPTGVVGVVAPEESPLLGLVAHLAPALVPGNTVVAVASQRWPLPAVTLGEVLATSDVPPGTVNLLTGSKEELLPWLAGHMDVDALDLSGAPRQLVTDLEEAAAGNLKRVVRHDGALRLSAVTGLVEHKTIWHPTGI